MQHLNNMKYVMNLEPKALNYDQGTVNYELKTMNLPDC